MEQTQASVRTGLSGLQGHFDVFLTADCGQSESRCEIRPSFLVQIVWFAHFPWPAEDGVLPRNSHRNTRRRSSADTAPGFFTWLLTAFGPSLLQVKVARGNLLAPYFPLRGPLVQMELPGACVLAPKLENENPDPRVNEASRRKDRID